MFTDVIDIAEKLGVFQAVKGKLLAQPDPAADHLVLALDEIYKIYLALDGELVAYLSLWLDEENPELKRERVALVRLEGGELTARMSRARGSCTKITNIYNRFLDVWFKRVLNKDEADQLADLFREMYEFDSQMIDAIDELANWLTQEAEATLDLIDERNLPAAQQRVMDARTEVKEERRAIANAMRDLASLQTAFTEVSGAL